MKQKYVYTKMTHSENLEVVNLQDGKTISKADPSNNEI